MKEMKISKMVDSIYYKRGVKDIAYSIPAIGNAIEKLSKY